MKQVPLALITFGVLLLCSYKNKEERHIEQNIIEYGIATLTIKYDKSVRDSMINKTTEIMVYNKLLGDYSVVNIEYNNSGTSELEIPVWFTTPATCDIGFSFYLVPDKSTSVNISLDGSNELIADVDMPLNVTADEISSLGDIIVDISQTYSLRRSDFPVGEEGNVEYFNSIVSHAQNYIDSKDDLTAIQHELSSRMAKLWLAATFTDSPKNIFDITKVDVIRLFDLNNPNNLYIPLYYIQFIDKLLDNYSDKLPPIGETNPKEWLNNTEKLVGRWVNNEQGVFYDMLVLTAYSRQLIYECRALSDSQKDNIKDYFNNKSIVKILIDENNTLIGQKEINAGHDITADSHPFHNTPKEDLLNTILSKHKGKVVVFDFWATWCGPCTQAIKESQELKKSYREII